VNVLFLEQAPSFGGGSERMSLALCQHALQRGHRTWLVHAAAGDMVPAYARAGATCRELPVTPVAVRHPLTAWRSFSGLRALVRQARIDVLFTSQVNYVSLLAAVGRWTGVRTSVHLGLTYDYPSPVFRTGMRLIDLAVTPSEHTADGWRRRDWPARSLRVIPNAVDTGVFHPGDGREAARRRLALSRSPAPLVAYVGRLVPDKGIFTLARAFARYRRLGGDGHLLFVGTAPGPEAAQLRQVATEEGLAGDVWSIRPATSVPEDVYRAADLIVVPSEWDEPFGLVPLEAMACGTVALVSNRGVLPEFVAPRRHDAVFAAGDPEGLSERLTHWLGDERRREDAAVDLSTYVRANFSFERCGDAYLAAFGRLVAR
jgi:glycosyltransferase involved in cell wall biosynthesis